MAAIHNNLLTFIHALTGVIGSDKLSMLMNMKINLHAKNDTFRLYISIIVNWPNYSGLFRLGWLAIYVKIPEGNYVNILGIQWLA